MRTEEGLTCEGLRTVFGSADRLVLQKSRLANQLLNVKTHFWAKFILQFLAAITIIAIFANEI